jgi:ferredoxin
MSFWFWHGLRRGIQSTRYPRGAEAVPGISPGRPINTEFETSGEAQSAASICPVGAIVAQGRSAFVDLGICVHCQCCRLSLPSPMNWDPGYEWTRLPAEQSECATLPSAFSKSMHIMVVDAGDCGDTNYCRDNAGHEISNNPTDETLRTLLSSIGIQIEAPPRSDNGRGILFFTNAILCLNTGGMQSKVEDGWFTGLRQNLLRKVSWDEAVMERLIEFERGKLPNAPLHTLFESAIERWERDNR